MHILVALADVHIIADTDHVSHKRDHVGCFPNRLTVSHLRFALIQILNLQPQQIAGRGKRKPGAGRIITEQRNPQTALKHLGGNVVLPHKPKGVGNRKHCLQLLIRLLPGKEKVAVVHLLKIQFI